MRRSVLLVVMLFVVSAGSLLAQQNPFLSTTPVDETPDTSRQTETTDTAPAPVVRQSRFLARTAEIQKNLQRDITSLLSGTENLKGLMIMLGLSFLYGVVHALGPGHRKTIIVGYFLGERARPLAGLGTGLLLAAEHGGSAVLLVGGFAWLSTKSVMLSMNTAQSILVPVSYGIIVILGIWMIVHGVYDHKRSKRRTQPEKKGLAGMLLSGLIPCPAATAIMIFSVATGYLATGILSVLSMSLGMGALLSAIGLATIVFRDRISQFVEEKRWGRYLELTLHCASGILLIVVGGIFLLNELAL